MSRSQRRQSAVVPCIVGAAVALAASAAPLLERSESDRDWPAYGGRLEQTRHSSLQQINRNNVSQLEVAWTYDTGEKGGLQTQPIVVDGVLYALTPSHKAFALRAATGELLWTFDSKIKVQGANR